MERTGADMYYIGCDNGVTGSIGIIKSDGSFYTAFKTPVKKELSYTKKAQYANRVDVPTLMGLLNPYKNNCKCVMERPMINPTRWLASMSARGALEATIIVMEMLCISYSYIDSKEWQKEMLPSGIKGSALLKKASLDIGRRLFPSIKHAKDADGILIAEYIRRRDK